MAASGRVVWEGGPGVGCGLARGTGETETGPHMDLGDRHVRGSEAAGPRLGVGQTGSQTGGARAAEAAAGAQRPWRARARDVGGGCGLRDFVTRGRGRAWEGSVAWAEEVTVTLRSEGWSRSSRGKRGAG